MNKFVNFGKRDVNLPAGCKDLIDVLRGVKQYGVESSCSVQGLASLSKYLRGIMESVANTKCILITWHEMNYVQLINDRGSLNVLALISDNTGREWAVREVFNAAGVSPSYDQAPAGIPIRALRYSLPADYPRIEKLVFDLLRRGYGLAENARLEIMFWEDEVG